MSQNQHGAARRKEGNPSVPEKHLLAMQEFVRKVGGLDKAKQAIESLRRLRKAA
jgi:hypothetical protein